MAKAVFKVIDGCDTLTIYCNACKSNHTFAVNGADQNKFNGDMHFPTMDKQINTEAIVEDTARENQCMFTLKKGYIHYAKNCRHPYYGQSCELMDYCD